MDHPTRDDQEQHGSPAIRGGDIIGRKRVIGEVDFFKDHRHHRHHVIKSSSHDHHHDKVDEADDHDQETGPRDSELVNVSAIKFG